MTISADVEYGCAGESLPITLAFRNNNEVAVEVDTPRVLLGGTHDGWVGQIDPVAVDANSTVTVRTVVQLPEIANGTHLIRVYGYAPGGQIVVGSP